VVAITLGFLALAIFVEVAMTFLFSPEITDIHRKGLRP
jgi:hypothetical protein